MRVLSVSQPWAQLIVRGMKLREVRSWGTDYRGRIAIHAASKAPSFDAVAKAGHDVAVAAWFADQRWHTRDDVLALPRSAIVGTVELTHVRPAPPDAESDESLDWIFTFADAVEFEPLGGISGKQRLWTLDDIASKEVEGRESARRATADDGGRAPRSLLPRDRGDAVVARFGRTLERRQQAESDHLKPMPNEALERRFRAKFDAYCAAHGMGGLTPTLERIRVAGPMARWFHSRTLPRITLERLLREELWRVAWQNEGRHSPREGILDWSFYNDRAPDDFDERIEPPTPRRKLTPSAEDNREARYRRMMATLDAVTAVASPPTSRARPPRISD